MNPDVSDFRTLLKQVVEKQLLELKPIEYVDTPDNAPSEQTRREAYKTVHTFGAILHRKITLKVSDVLATTDTSVALPFREPGFYYQVERGLAHNAADLTAALNLPLPECVLELCRICADHRDHP